MVIYLFFIWPMAEFLKKNFICFLVDLMTPKFRFEIYWPLASSGSVCILYPPPYSQNRKLFTPKRRCPQTTLLLFLLCAKRARRASAVRRRHLAPRELRRVAPVLVQCARTNFDVNNMAMASPLHSSTLLPLKNNNNRRSMWSSQRIYILWIHLWGSRHKLGINPLLVF